MGAKDDPKSQIIIHCNLEDYLVKGTDVGQTDDKCFIPIFVTDPDLNTDVFNTWFLGSMFMDRYFIMHDMESATFGTDQLPRIGIYDKWLKRDGSSTKNEEEVSFTSVTGHCSDKANLRREGTDYKNLGKGISFYDCRH